MLASSTELAKFVTDQAVGDPNFESRSRLLCSYASLCLLHPMATGVALSPDQRLARAEAMMKVFREFVKAYDKSPLGERSRHPGIVCVRSVSPPFRCPSLCCERRHASVSGGPLGERV